MPTEFSIDAINDYFAHLNPIALKIASDINETRSTYEHIWNQLKPSEHNDIINETLIKPEISLRYFDNFTSSSPSSSSVSSSKSVLPSASSSSLTAVLCAVAASTTTESSSGKQNDATSAAYNLQAQSLKHFNGYDGRNLSTFADQKVALKIVHDDTLGAYRDEHSLPFSFKTKSQINLRIFNGNDDDEFTESQSQQQAGALNGDYNDGGIMVLNVFGGKSEPLNRATAENYKKLQTELANNLSNRIRSSCSTGVTKANVFQQHAHAQTQAPSQSGQHRNTCLSLRLKSEMGQATPSMTNNPVPVSSSSSSTSATTTTVAAPVLFFDKVDSKYERFYDESPVTGVKAASSTLLPPPAGPTTELSLLKLISKNTAGFLSSTSMTTATAPSFSSNSVRNIRYNDYTDDQESANLMMNCSSSGLTLTSSSSAPSEDGNDYDRSDDEDNKTLCEDVKLLLNNDGLQKGFDFLNNW